MITGSTLAVDLNGDAAFEGLMTLTDLYGLLGSLVLVTIFRMYLKAKWGPLVMVVLSITANLLWNHWLFIAVDGFRGGELNWKGDATLQGLLSLGSLGGFVASFAVVLVLRWKAKANWDIWVMVILSFATSILYNHWMVPFWNSLDMSF